MTYRYQRRQASRWRRPPLLPAGEAYVFLTYRWPRDFAGYVVRAFEVTPRGLLPAELIAAGSLAECRRALPFRVRHRIARLASDHRLIFEFHY